MSFIINPYVHDAYALIGPNTGMNLSFNVLKSMMVEGDIPLTDVANDGDAVGLIYDQTENGLILRHSGANQQPILGSDGTRNSFITFDGTNDRQTVLTSLSFLNTFWQAVPKGTFLMWLKMNGGDGVTQRILDNVDGNIGANAGIQIFRPSSNKLVARGGNGSAILWTYTSTTNVVAATGWVGLIVSVNGTGASAGRFILMDSAGTILEDQTFSVAAGTTVNAATDLVIGTKVTTPDLFWNGSLSALIIENFPVTDNLIAQFKEHNPARITTEFPPIVQYLMDMNNNAFIFNNAAGTVQVGNGDFVRVIRSSVVGNFNTTPSFGALRRIWASASDAASAIYRINEINGHATIEFNGNDNYTMTAVNGTLFQEMAGKNTFFLVMKNNNVTTGSHPFSGNNYIVLTGSGYSSGAGLTYPYFVIHPDPVGTQVAQASENAGVDDYKIIAYRRNGTALDAWNGDKQKSSSTSSSRFSINNMGLENPNPIGDWNMNGHIAYWAKYNGVMTDAQVEAEIDRLKARFGL